ncbi:MAG: hypothetical protein GY835_15975 [bacterium]|nr:hypothetical protein [bacterium]
MDTNTFLQEEYRTLREEIKETKSRIYKTLSYGLIVVPAAHYLAKSYELEIVLYSTPLLVIVVALLYLSENHGLMRCGRYILLEIEPHVEEVFGWESWLETQGTFDPRTVDKFVSICFYVLYLVYFTGSVYLATIRAIDRMGMLAASLILGIYSAVGLWFLIYLFRHIRTTTRTVLDSEEKVAQAREFTRSRSNIG